MIPVFQKLPLTRIVDNLMELKSCEEDTDYCYLDPKLLRPQDATNAAARTRNSFPGSKKSVSISIVLSEPKGVGFISDIDSDQNQAHI